MWECCNNAVRERWCSCVVGLARRNMYTMRRSSGRTAQGGAVLVAVEIEWARRLSGGGKLRSPSEILGKNKRMVVVVVVLMYYYYAGWVDAAIMLSRCRREWRMGGCWSGRKKRAVLWNRRMH